MMRIIFILLLFTRINAIESSDSIEDPSGWSSYYVTESKPFKDSVDVVDPSGWNYDRQAKRSISKEHEDKSIINVCKSVLEDGNFDTKDVIISKIEDTVKSRIETLFTKETKMNDNMVFVKRFISILLEAADLSEETRSRGDYVKSVIEISASREQLKTLIHFSNSKVNVSLRELDYILSASIHRKHIPVFDVSAAIEKTFFFASQKEVWLPIFLGCIILGIHRLLITSKTKTCFVTSVVIFIFCLSYVIEYYRMYKDAEISQRTILEKYPDVPKSCNPGNRYWFASLIDSLWTSVSFKNDECEQYQKALLLDPLVDVSPVRVLSNILIDFIVQPSEKIGTAIAVFATAILGELPIQYGWFVWLGSCIGVCLLIMLAFVLLINGSIHFSYLFGGIRISSSQAPSVTSAPQVHEIAAKVPHPQLEGVTGIKNPVLIDASALGTLLLRAQTNVAVYHSGVEELVQSPQTASSSKSSDETLVSSSDQEIPLEASEKSPPPVIACPETGNGQQELVDAENERNSDIQISSKDSATSETKPVASIKAERKSAETVKEDRKHTEDVSANVKNVRVSEID